MCSKSKVSGSRNPKTCDSEPDSPITNNAIRSVRFANEIVYFPSNGRLHPSSVPKVSKFRKYSSKDGRLKPIRKDCLKKTPMLEPIRTSTNSLKSGKASRLPESTTISVGSTGDAFQKASLLSTLGIEKFRKLYIAELESYTKDKEESYKAKLDSALTEDESEDNTDYSDYGESATITSAESTPEPPRTQTEVQRLSTAVKVESKKLYKAPSKIAQLAQLKCYEDTLVDRLAMQDKHLAQSLNRIQTPSLGNLLKDRPSGVSREGSLVVPKELMEALRKQKNKSDIRDCVQGLNEWSESISKL